MYPWVHNNDILFLKNIQTIYQLDMPYHYEIIKAISNSSIIFDNYFKDNA